MSSGFGGRRRISGGVGGDILICSLGKERFGVRICTGLGLGEFEGGRQGEMGRVKFDFVDSA